MDFLNSLKNAWDEVPPEAPPADETPSPHLNALIQVIRGHQQGTVPQAQVQREIREMSARLELALHDHDTLYGASELPEEVRELAQKARDSFQKFSQGLDALRAALESGGSPEAGLDLCKQAAAALEARSREFTELQKRESLPRCLMCSHVNQPNARNCARCGAVLPEQMERSAAARESTTSDLVMVPPEYMDLYNACDAVAGGRMEVAEWRRVLDPLWHAFNQTREAMALHLAQHSQDLDGAPELKPVAEALMEGLGRAEAALDQMARFEEDGDPEHLNDGWMALLKGTRKVQESGAIFLSTLNALRMAAAEAAEAAGAEASQ